jgi:6,7-dimethyl-8-ribityllumazine synthase
MNAGQVTTAASGVGLKIGIIASRFNPEVTEGLLDGALRALSDQGVQTEDIAVFRTPGAFEIPGLVKHLGRLRRFDALICLGAVIQGETPHFHYICSEVSRGIGRLSLELDIPVLFGILTTTTLAQAQARSGVEGNKGAEAALAAIEMARVYQSLQVAPSIYCEA